MKQIVFLFSMILVLSSCDSKNGNLKIKGKVENSDVDYIYIQKLGTSSATNLDSAFIEDNGDFNIVTDIENSPSFYRLILDQSRYTNLVLKANDNIEFNTDAQNFTGSFSVKGSKESTLLKEVIGYQHNFYFKQDSLNKERQVYMRSRDMSNYGITLQNLQVLTNNYVGQLKGFIDQNPSSMAALVAAEQLDPNEHLEYLEKVKEGISKTIPDSEYYKNFSEKVNKFKRLSIGAEAPELAFSSPTGEVLKLSDYRGKYVLIDFWASWCRPCRMENPNVVKLYNQYKEKGFEIYGVSLDQKKGAWENAITMDNISWPQVSDLGGWQSNAAKVYNVSSIPATYLLDPKGVIIAKNLRGGELANKLSEIFADYN